MTGGISTNSLNWRHTKNWGWGPYPFPLTRSLSAHAGWRGLENSEGSAGLVPINLPRIAPADDVRKSDQAIKQRRDDERLFAMDMVAFAGHLEMLNDGLGADF